METIIARQNNAAKPATGRVFVLGIARIIVELAIVQAVVNFLIRLTGIGLLNLLFYLYAAWLLIRFMTRTVAGQIYTLKEETLEMQRLLGDSTVLGVQIPLDAVLSIRPVVYGEKLALDYRRVTYVDSTCAPGIRMHAAFAVSLLWAWLARVIAGKKAHKSCGTLIAYMEEGKHCACVFRPDEAFLAALEAALPDVFGVDERLERGMKETYSAKSLRRTFGDLYPHVPSAVSEEELAFEREEFARRREAHLARQAEFLKIPLPRYKGRIVKIERFLPSCKRRLKRLIAAAADRITFFKPIGKKIDAFAEKVRQEEAMDRAMDQAMDQAMESAQEETQSDAPRRRRGRQE